MKIDVVSTLVKAFGGAVYVYLLLPLVIIIVSSFGSTEYLVFPPQGLTLAWYEKIFVSPKWMDSILLSLAIAVAATLITVSMGTSVTYALARYRIPGKRLLLSLLLVPLAVPQIVIGIGLLYFFTSARWIDTFPALVVAHCLVGLPFVVRCVRISVETLDISLERAAMSLGANEVQTLLKVTLPLIKPGAVAGAIFAFVFSLGEASITVLITGVRLTTLPVRIFSYMQFQFDPSVTAVSSIMIIASIVAIFLLDRIIGIETSTRIV